MNRLTATVPLPKPAVPGLRRVDPAAAGATWFWLDDPGPGYAADDGSKAHVPHDGDGDGWINDGTPSQAPIPPPAPPIPPTDLLPLGRWATTVSPAVHSARRQAFSQSSVKHSQLVTAAALWTDSPGGWRSLYQAAADVAGQPSTGRRLTPTVGSLQQAKMLMAAMANGPSSQKPLYKPLLLNQAELSKYVPGRRAVTPMSSWSASPAVASAWMDAKSAGAGGGAGLTPVIVRLDNGKGLPVSVLSNSSDRDIVGSEEWLIGGDLEVVSVVPDSAYGGSARATVVTVRQHSPGFHPAAKGVLVDPAAAPQTGRPATVSPSSLFAGDMIDLTGTSLPVRHASTGAILPADSGSSGTRRVTNVVVGGTAVTVRLDDGTYIEFPAGQQVRTASTASVSAPHPASPAAAGTGPAAAASSVPSTGSALSGVQAQSADYAKLPLGARKVADAQAVAYGGWTTPQGAAAGNAAVAVLAASYLPGRAGPKPAGGRARAAIAARAATAAAATAGPSPAVPTAARTVASAAPASPTPSAPATPAKATFAGTTFIASPAKNLAPGDTVWLNPRDGAGNPLGQTYSVRDIGSAQRLGSTAAAGVRSVAYVHRHRHGSGMRSVAFDDGTYIEVADTDELFAGPSTAKTTASTFVTTATTPNPPATPQVAAAAAAAAANPQVPFPSTTTPQPMSPLVNQLSLADRGVVAGVVRLHGGWSTPQGSAAGNAAAGVLAAGGSHGPAIAAAAAAAAATGPRPATAHRMPQLRSGPGAPPLIGATTLLAAPTGTGPSVNAWPTGLANLDAWLATGGGPGPLGAEAVAELETVWGRLHPLDRDDLARDLQSVGVPFNAPNTPDWATIRTAHPAFAAAAAAAIQQRALPTQPPTSTSAHDAAKTAIAAFPLAAHPSYAALPTSKAAVVDAVERIAPALALVALSAAPTHDEQGIVDEVQDTVLLGSRWPASLSASLDAAVGRHSKLGGGGPLIPHVGPLVPTTTPAPFGTPQAPTTRLTVPAGSGPSTGVYATGLAHVDAFLATGGPQFNTAALASEAAKELTAAYNALPAADRATADQIADLFGVPRGTFPVPSSSAALTAAMAWAVTSGYGHPGGFQQHDFDRAMRAFRTAAVNGTPMTADPNYLALTPGKAADSPPNGERGDQGRVGPWCPRRTQNDDPRRGVRLREVQRTADRGVDGRQVRDDRPGRVQAAPHRRRLRRNDAGADPVRVRPPGARRILGARRHADARSDQARAEHRGGLHDANPRRGARPHGARQGPGIQHRRPVRRHLRRQSAGIVEAAVAGRRGTVRRRSRHRWPPRTRSCPGRVRPEEPGAVPVLVGGGVPHVRVGRLVRLGDLDRQRGRVHLGGPGQAGGLPG